MNPVRATYRKDRMKTNAIDLHSCMNVIEEGREMEESNLKNTHITFTFELPNALPKVFFSVKY